MTKAKISIGCFVYAKLGSLLPLKENGKRKIRANVDGIVLKSLPDKKFRVYWNSIDRTADMKKNSIFFKAKPDERFSETYLQELDVPSKHISGTVSDLRDYIERSFQQTTSRSTSNTARNTSSVAVNNAINLGVSNVMPPTTAGHTGTSSIATSSTGTTISPEDRARELARSLRLLAAARAASAGLDQDFGLDDETSEPQSSASGTTTVSHSNSGATELRLQILLPATHGQTEVSNSSASQRTTSTDPSASRASSLVSGPSTATTTATATTIANSRATERSQILLQTPRRDTGSAPSRNQNQDSSSDTTNGTNPTASSASGASSLSSRDRPATDGTDHRVVVEDVTEDDDNDGNNPNYQRENYDPAEIVADIIENGDLYARKWAVYLREKKDLIDANVRVTCGKNNDAVEWTVCDDVKKETVPNEVPFNGEIGIGDFEFANLTEQTGDPEVNTNKRINLMKLLLHLWPGCLKHQLRVLNQLIQHFNDTKDQSERSRKLISKREYLKFLGIMLLARVEGVKGGRLWADADKCEGIQKIKRIAKEYMTHQRFREIADVVPFLWSSEELKEAGDAWWEVSDVCRLFAENRKRTVRSSNVKTADESMSAFKPRTTKKGNLPHISFIIRKPKPLGTEFKSIACAYLKAMLSIELCRGKDDRLGREFERQLKKKTTACSVHLMNGANQRKEYHQKAQEAGDDWNNSDWPANDDATDDLFLGDSWFGSVATAKALRNTSVMDNEANSIMQIKTATSGYPKKFLDETMLNWPGGSHLVLKATIDGVNLYAVGYKYSSKKNLCFVFTEGASHTEPGDPYVASWKDENGNSRFRNVPRPECCGRYFKHSNTIDVINQLRQDELALEEHWITEDGYFRIFTTILGICVTDAYNGYKHHLKHNHRHKKVTIYKFANMMCLDLLTNKEDDGIETENTDGAWSIGAGRKRPMKDKNVATPGNGYIIMNENGSVSSNISSITNPPFLSPFLSPDGGSYTRIRDMDDFLAVEAGKHFLVRTGELYSCKRPRLSSTRSGGEVHVNAKRTKTCGCRECKQRGRATRRKVSTYCHECKPDKGCHHYWLCEECAVEHRNDVKEALRRGERLG